MRCEKLIFLKLRTYEGNEALRGVDRCKPILR